MQIRKLAIRSLAFFALVLSASCSERDITIDPSEQYTRDFVKEFGAFKAESWTEAVSGAITVVADRPTPVDVFAEIDGRRFIFASLGSVKGTQPIIVNVPRTVKEVIVVADGTEYRAKLGTVVDLSTKGRFISELDYSPITTLGGFAGHHATDVLREIELKGNDLFFNFLDNRGRDNGFHIGDSKRTFRYDDPNSIYCSSRFKLDSDVYPWMTIYPLYWRENKYGESDYLLGFYIWHWNDPGHIEMHDLEDFDIKGGIKISTDGENWTVSGEGKEAYDYTALNNKQTVRFKGAHLRFENIDKKINHCIGFYLKSGLKEGYTENRGRNYTHISFQNLAHNSEPWGENYWDVPLKGCQYAYSGAVGTMTNLTSNCRPTHVDGTTGNSVEGQVNDIYMYPLAFTSAPAGIDGDLPDFSDVVFAVSFKGNYGRYIPMGGEVFGQYPWYLAAEDLGSTDDWDFNDLVVNVYDLTTDFTRPYTSANKQYPVPDVMGRRITVLPRAAGGTMPIYLMYEGEVSSAPTDDTPLSAINSGFVDGTYVVGTEMHSWLGSYDHTLMLNTGDDCSAAGRAVSFCVPIAKKGTDDFNPMKPPQNVGVSNQTMRGFWVLVDKNDEMRSQLYNAELDPTPLEDVLVSNKIRNRSETVNALKPFAGRLGEGAYRVDAPINGGGSVAPQMLMCFHQWKWPRERVKISDAYSQFSDWVAGKRQQWHDDTATGSTGEGTNGYFADKVCDVKAPTWSE